MALNWINPGTDEWVATEDFVRSEEAQELRPPIMDQHTLDDGGRGYQSSELAARKNTGMQVSIAPLESILREILSSNFGRQIQPVATSEGWDGLTESLMAAEKDYEGQANTRWRRIWYGAGDKADLATPWIDLIPNEYGLAIVKASVAVILRLARNSRQKRDKILQAFEDIQRAMKSVDPLKGAFQSNKDVRSARHELHETIVESVNDMLLLTAKREHSWRGVKKVFGQRTKNRDIDSVLELLSNKTQRLKEAMEDAQNQSIDTINAKTTYTAVGTAHVLRGVSHLGGKVDLQSEEIRSVNVALQEQNALLKALFEAQMNNKDEIAGAHLRSAGEAPPSDLNAWYIRKLEDMFFANKMDTEVQQYFTPKMRSPPGGRRRAVINEMQFCEAIAGPALHEDQVPDIEGFIAQPDNDWAKVTTYSGEDDSKTQSQVRSILHEKRFHDWMRSRYPDLILLLADLPAGAMENINAVSVFCATFITSLTNLRREDVVLHFFCGLHVDSRDPNPGPRGLVRSLIMQLYAYLTRTGSVNLDFICDRDYVQDIGNEHLGALCQVLRELLWQCEPGTYVYCIIDSVTLFERQMWFRDLKVVARCLRECVDNVEIPVIFKVMMTSLALCTPELKELLAARDRHPEAVLYLSSDNSLVDGGLGVHDEERYFP